MSQPITRIGIDLAKNVFQACTTDATGKVLSNRRVSRKQLPSLIANTPACDVVMEACASAHYWARVFERMGHSIKLIHPAYVKPYVKTNKHDAADAEALCEAAMRHMHKRDDALSQWACKVKAKKGHAKAIVALANKLARICWAVPATDTPYKTNFA